MTSQRRKKRVPQLKYTRLRNIGWHVSFRDPATGTPCRHRFGLLSREEAEAAYYEWVAAHFRGETVVVKRRVGRRMLDEQLATPKPTGVPAEIVPGSLLEVNSGLLGHDESRVRLDGDARRTGTITRKTYEARKQYAEEFLRFLNSVHGQGAVGRMRLADLSMKDVESFNRLLAEAGYSSSQVTKRLQLVKATIDRAGRPEHGHQLLTWNWDSRDVAYGKPAKLRKLPTLRQLKLVLANCDRQKTAMVWMAIGCGFGQRDLAEACVGQFDEQGYDLRRGKTGIERYGETPEMVWRTLQDHSAKVTRQAGERVFLTRNGMPLVHERADSVTLWWGKLRARLRDDGEGLGGFYTLRHLGATDFGSRSGCSIGAMKRWLGHSASSQVADVYMKPVSPENRAVIEWVRESLASGEADLTMEET